MKKITVFFLLVFFWMSFVVAQTSLKGNLQTALFGIPNFGVETVIGKKTTFQLDVTASFWKSVDGNPYEFYLVFPEFRYYPKKAGNGFFVGAHVGGSEFKVQKWNYFNADYYQDGYGLMFGMTLGYQFQINKLFNVELFMGGGNHLAFYKGYSITTNERIDTAKKYNKSGEIIPYRFGLMLVYKLQ